MMNLPGVNRIDQAIYESELETANGFEPVDAEEVFQNWRRIILVNIK